MITLADFKSIEGEVEFALNQLFDHLEAKALRHNYVAFLADGEYEHDWSGRSRLNPYSIDNRKDRYKDESRLNFFIHYMRTFYDFSGGREVIDDDEYRITLEMMIYCHAWESKPILKKLFRLAELANYKSYPWHVDVPEMSKHSYIRFDIRDRFAARGLIVANVIRNSFHTSLRNAFAHSEYQINTRRKVILLDTYKGANWDIKEISFDDWSKRFAYTSWLVYLLHNIAATRKTTMGIVNPEQLILHPKSSEKHLVARHIYYDTYRDSFSFYR
ncbi:hypothetical protein SAMN04487898_12373 [Pedobacter sp. ok626]|uniref:hypothetical protein n=1 Tax=Pedobacter sp. ok626 TaxID=1761882 RepID=UPI00088D3043|nr:hypothetical protein [Pedobacter sp. ok626]SDL72257.1 hypothetical protein SAMN04487898_12373 [Pedobacter sp. ok626]